MHLPKLDQPFPDFNHVFTGKSSTHSAEPNSFLKYTVIAVLMTLLGSSVVLLPLMLLKQIGFSNNSEIGESHGFIKAGLLIQESLNTSMNPCEDFYEYVCGNYVKNNPLRPGEKAISEIDKISTKTEYQLMELLGSKSNSTSAAISKMKIIYNSCVMEKNYDNRTPSVALEEIKSVGHWPLVMGNQNENIDLQEMFEKLDMFTVSNMFLIGVSRDIKNKSRIVVAFEQGQPLFDWKYYHFEDFDNLLKASEDRVRNRIKLFAQNNGYPEIDNFDDELSDMLDFDFSVAKIMRDPDFELSPEESYNIEPFDRFNERMKTETGLDFKKILLAGMPEHARGLITADTVIMVQDPTFAENIAKLIKNANPKTLANYLMYRLMSKYNPFYGEEYRATDEKLIEEIYGRVGRYSPWGKCKEIAMKMKKAVGALYARTHFDQESREVMMEMVGNLKEAFVEMVDESEWMDEETKRAAKKKAQEMIPHIGYNRLAFDDEKLDEYYKDVDVSDFNDFHVMYAKLLDWERHLYFKRLLDPQDRQEFFDVSSTVNAMFSPLNNAILFPAAYLQFPMFKKDQPQSLNYGGIGSIIGHEITHGFDDYGKEFDEIGQLRNWWADETLKKFDEKGKCMEEQYSSIEVPGTDGIHLNGEMTLGENIADNGGIQEAYRAYQKYVKHHGNEPKVPGVSLNEDQLFFVGYANSYCGTISRQTLVNQILTDEHSPWKYRTNTVLQNMPEFSKVFSCPVGSPMNPEKKCRVW